jgi:hypothetical protein
MGMLLEEVGGKPFTSEEPQKPDSEEIIDNSDETEEPAAEADDSSDEEEAKDDESEDEEEAPEPDKVQRRINKLTAQKLEALEKAQNFEVEATTAKQRLAELESQLSESSRPVLSPTADSPLADVDTPEALDAKIQSAQQVRRWALRNTDGATITRPDGSEAYLDSDQVKDYLLRADDILTIHAPQRQQWLSQRQPAVEAARNVFPDMFRAGTQMHAAYKATIKDAPELLKVPKHELWVGLALYGEQQLMAAQKAQSAKATAAKKVSSASAESKTPTPANPVSNAKSTTKGTVRRDVRDRVMSGGGGLDDLASFMSDRLFG